MQLSIFKKTPFKNRGNSPETAPEKFDIIYCDPPWSYNDVVMRGASKVPTGSAEDHYPTMSNEELAAMNVQGIAAKNCLCIMWTTSPHLETSINLLKEWGFKYVCIGFVWHKQALLPSSYFLSSVELAIIGKRGAIPGGRPKGERSQLQFLSRMRTRHSAKPAEFRRRIERAFPKANKIELFAREADPGWWCWGNQAPGGLDLPLLMNPDPLPW